MAVTVLEPAASQDLTTLDAVKAECGITGSADDALLGAMIRRASAACARYCNRPGFGRERVAQTERCSGPVILERDLEPQIVSVTAGGAVLAEEDWVLEGPVVRRPYGSLWATLWPSPIVVEYWAGFELLATLPEDIEEACLIIVASKWHARGRDPSIRSMTTEGVGQVVFDTGAAAAEGYPGIPPEASLRLEPWRRPGF
jgi:hypothetical protein